VCAARFQQECDECFHVHQEELPGGLAVASISNGVATLRHGDEYEVRLTLVPAPELPEQATEPPGPDQATGPAAPDQAREPVASEKTREPAMPGQATHAVPGQAREPAAPDEAMRPAVPTQAGNKGGAAGIRAEGLEGAAAARDEKVRVRLFLSDTCTQTRMEGGKEGRRWGREEREGGRTCCAAGVSSNHK
jgi:hypothetical protein